MEKEAEPAVLALMNEKRLLGDKLTPVEIIARLGVLDARKEASAHAWLTTGDNVIVTLWAEFVNVAASGRWFYLESLDTTASSAAASAARCRYSAPRTGWTC